MKITPIQSISYIKNNHKNNHQRKNKKKNNLTSEDISVILDLEIEKRRDKDEH